MGALMDATGCCVSRPREDAATKNDSRGEGRRTHPALTFAPDISYPILFCIPVIISHHLLRLSSASLPVVFSISGWPSPFPTFSPPLLTAVSLAPPIVFTGHRSPSVPLISQCLLHSFGSPIVFSVHHLPLVPLPSPRLLHSRLDLPSSLPVFVRFRSRSLPAVFSIPDRCLRFRCLHSRPCLLYSRPPSPFPPFYSPLVCLRSHSLPPVFSHSNESHTSSGYARATALACGHDQARKYLRPSVGV
ncbi:hypothetical protein ACLOJK_018429 [Asimina triloba]